jgi:hypothetical protein
MQNESQNIQYVCETKKECSEDVTKKSFENTTPVETPHYKLYREALRVKCIEIL